MRRVYLREATVILVIARLAIRLLPPKVIFEFADRPPRHIRRFAGYEIDWVSWAVENADKSRWASAKCLARAIAAQTMLRRRGIASQLCLGVARNEVTVIAHAWVEIGPKVIVGGAERNRFTKIEEFGQKTFRRQGHAL